MNKTKILIVEDETIVAFDIEIVLEKLGYEVSDSVDNYEDAIKSVKENEPTLILMDINLENSKDGIETAKSIQEIKSIPIIYLTAFSDEKTIEKALSTNPVGYITKPFKESDLKTSIILGLHKANFKSEDKEIFNSEYTQLNEEFFYDMKNENLYFKNIPIKLSIKEKALLNLLLNARGSIVSFQDIEYNIWSDKTVASSTLRALISRLRAKLEYKIIETIPSFGCRLEII